MRKRDKPKPPPPPEPTGWEKLKDYVSGEGYDRYLQISGKPEPKKL